MHHSNQVQFLTPHMPSHVVLVVLVLSCGMQGLVHPVARSGPSELPVVPISQLMSPLPDRSRGICPLASGLQQLHQSMRPSHNFAWAVQSAKIPDQSLQFGVMVGLRLSKHVLPSRGAALPSPACSHHLSCVSPSACVSARSAAPLSWFNPPCGHMITSAKMQGEAPTWGPKGKPAVDWHILFKKPTPWLCVQSKSGAFWSHDDTYLLCIIWTTHPALAQ